MTMQAALHLPLVGAVAGLVLAAACATAEGAAEGGDEARLAGNWILVELAGEPRPEDAPPLTLEVAEDAVSGSGGCNGFRGTLERPAAGELRIGPIAATKRGCPGPILEREVRYFRLLERSVRWRRDGDRLELATAEESAASLVFQPRPSGAGGGR